MEQQSLLESIYAIVRDIVKREVELTPRTHLLTVGIDSMGIVHLIARCEAKFGFQFNPRDLVMSKLMTPSAIAVLLQERYGVGISPSAAQEK